MSTTPKKVHGADISHHQAGKIDLVAAKRTGLQWLYHKATEGNTVTDDHYKARRDQAKKAGLPFGAYHFARPEKSDAVSEAKRFLSVAKPLPGDLRPVLDLEDDGGLSAAALRAWAKAWCTYVGSQVGVNPIVYGPFDLGDAVKGCLLWRPRYNSTNTPPVLKWDIWQFSNGISGVPNQFFGLGHVDLNTMRPGLRTAQMLIPKPQPKKTRRVEVSHAPLEFGDTPKQHTADITKIFERFKEQGVSWATGTEAGPGANNTSDELVRIGTAAGYRMWVPAAQPKGHPGWATDCWIAVRESEIAGGWGKGYIQAFDGSTGIYRAMHKEDPSNQKPKWGPKGLVWVRFRTHDLGTVSVGAAHLLTSGNTPGKVSVVNDVDHYALNTRLTKVIGDWAAKEGAGKAIVTYGGDQNDQDAKHDTFRGQPLTSVADELDKYPSTGHGAIDVIATYDADSRVKAAWWRTLDDKAFPLNVDHFLCEAGLDIRTVN